MSPKEKAKELVDKYLDAMYYGIKISPTINNKRNSCYDQGIKCALIAVEQILNLRMVSNMCSGHDNMSELEYWESVKEEMQKL